MKNLVLLRLLLVKTAAVVAVLTTLTITTETRLVTITVEAGSLLTRKSGVHSSVGVGDNVVRKVEELTEILETRISQGVVEVAPAVGLVDISTRPERLKQLNDLQVADGDIFSVLVLSKHIGGMDVINSGEDSVLKELTVNQKDVLSINEHFNSTKKQG